MSQSIRRNIFVLLSLLLVVLSVGIMSARPAPDSGDDVREAQQTLRDKGYYAGPIDGILGSRTRAAIRHYQKDENEICLSIFGRALEKIGNATGKYHKIDIDALRNKISNMIRTGIIETFTI